MSIHKPPVHRPLYVARTRLLYACMMHVKEVQLPTISNSLKASWNFVRDPLKRSRLRWFMLGWFIALPTVLLGGGFTVAGSHLVISQGAYAIWAHVPGGLHTHGIILLTLGLALVVGLAAPLFGNPEPRTWLRRTLVGIAYYYGWSAATFALAPLAGGLFSFVGIVIWTTLALMPVVLLVGPPPTLIPKTHTDLIRAAIEVGIEPSKARALAETYLYGGEDVCP